MLDHVDPQSHCGSKNDRRHHNPPIAHGRDADSDRNKIENHTEAHFDPRACVVGFSEGARGLVQRLGIVQIGLSSSNLI